MFDHDARCFKCHFTTERQNLDIPSRCCVETNQYCSDILLLGSSGCEGRDWQYWYEVYYRLLAFLTEHHVYS